MEEPGAREAVAGNAQYLNSRTTHSLGRLGDDLREMIGHTQFRAWFRDIRFEGVTDNTLWLSVPSKFVKTKLLQHYREYIIACWQKGHSSKIVHLEICVRRALSPKAKEQ